MLRSRVDRLSASETIASVSHHATRFTSFPIYGYLLSDRARPHPSDRRSTVKFATGGTGSRCASITRTPVTRAGETLVEASVQVAFVSGGRARPIPKPLRAAMQADRAQVSGSAGTDAGKTGHAGCRK